MQVTNPTIHAGPEAPAHPAASPQLVKAANEFEANFLGELLKPMREDPLFGEGSGLGGDSLGSDGPGGAMGTIGNLASEAFAQALAKQGGLGIAKQVLAELGPMEAARSQQAKVLTGSECGACAKALAMEPEAQSALEAGSVEMLGQGGLPALQRNQAEKDTMDKRVHGGIARESRKHLRPMGAVRAIEPAQ